MVAAFGIGFQFPVLLVFLQLVGVLTPRQLIKQWRYAMIIIFVRGRRDHPVRRPDLDARSGHPDDDPVLRLVLHRLAGRAQRRKTSTPQQPPERLSACPPTPTGRPLIVALHRSRSTTSSSRRSTRSTPATRRRRRADRQRQDRRRRIRHRVGSRGRTPGLLHGADQGPVEPEVPRPASALRRATSACSPATTRSTGTHPWS